MRQIEADEAGEHSKIATAPSRPGILFKADGISWSDDDEEEEGGEGKDDEDALASPRAATAPFPVDAHAHTRPAAKPSSPYYTVKHGLGDTRSLASYVLGNTVLLGDRDMQQLEAALPRTLQSYGQSVVRCQ